MDNIIDDTVKIESDIILIDKYGKIIHVETPIPELVELWV